MGIYQTVPWGAITIFFLSLQGNYKSNYGEFFTEPLFGLGANAKASGKHQSLLLSEIIC